MLLGLKNPRAIDFEVLQLKKLDWSQELLEFIIMEILQVVVKMQQKVFLSVDVIIPKTPHTEAHTCTKRANSALFALKILQICQI